MNSINFCFFGVNICKNNYDIGITNAKEEKNSNIDTTIADWDIGIIDTSKVEDPNTYIVYVKRVYRAKNLNIDIIDIDTKRADRANNLNIGLTDIDKENK